MNRINILSQSLLLLLAFVFLPLDELHSEKKTARNAFIDTTLFNDFIEEDFPCIGSALDLSKAPKGFPKNNYTPRGLMIQLADEHWACFDRDLLRVSAVWQGGDFELNTMSQISYPGTGKKSKEFPYIIGDLRFATGPVRGISTNGKFDDPRDNSLGPMEANLGEWKGLHLSGKDLILSYAIAGIDVLESICLTEKGAFLRHLKFDSLTRDIDLLLFEKEGLAGLKKSESFYSISDGNHRIALYCEGAEPVLSKGRLSLKIKKGTKELRIQYAYDLSKLEMNLERKFPDKTKPSFQRWEDVISSNLTLSDSEESYVLDDIQLPMDNPWRRSLRPAGLDFFPDGRAAMVTFDGDVWLIDGLGGRAKTVTWKRFASGIYSPLTLKIHEGEIYVFGRDQVHRLHDINGDDEADFYENYSTAFLQAMNTRDYALDMIFANNGDMYLAKGGIQNMGGKLDNNDFYFSAHAGSVIRVYNDGKSFETFADGFREPFIGYDSDADIIYANDQQGNYIPATPVIALKDGLYYGHHPSNYRKLKSIEPPTTWVPHKIDSSAAGMSFINSSKMGPLNKKMLVHSYGKMLSLLVYNGDGFGGVVQLPGMAEYPLLKGAVNPLDGQLYVTGMKIYSSESRELAGLSRLRYTAAPVSFPLEFDVYREGVQLTFDAPLEKASLENVKNYEIKRWNYKRSEEYGSGHYNLDGEPGEERILAAKAIASKDGKSVFLLIPGLTEVEQMAISYKLSATDHKKEHALYFTINELKKDLSADHFAASAKSGINMSEALVKTAKLGNATIEKGKQLLEQYACITCHSIDGSTEGKIGPTFKGMMWSNRHFNKAETQLADEEFIRESLYEPNIKIAQGYQVAMGSYAGVLNDADIDSIILYLNTLR